MTKLVIDTVNQMAYKQGYKSFKFFDRKKRPMLLNPIDTLSGIDGMINENLEALEQADEEYLPLVPPKSQSNDEDSELVVDLPIDNKEIADLLGDAHEVNQDTGNAEPDNNQNMPGEDESGSENDNLDQCNAGNDDNIILDPPSL